MFNFSQKSANIAQISSKFGFRPSRPRLCHFSNGLSVAGLNLSTAIVPHLEPIARPLGSEVGLGFELLYFILEILSKRSSLVEISFKRLFRDLQAWLAGSAMQLARLRPQSSVNRDPARFFSF